MLVTRENLAEVIERFTRPGQKSVDTETTGLYPYLGDRLFSIILGDDLGAAYFNFQSYPNLDDKYVLPDPSQLAPIFKTPGDTWFAHNAKFDMAMLRFDGIEIAGIVHCTQAIGRLIYNKHFEYSLDNLVKEIGLVKNKAVEEYITKNKLWQWEEIPGKKKRVKKKFYDKVPFDIMSRYGLDDGTITRALGLWQMAQIEIMAQQMPSNVRDNFRRLYENECRLTKTCFEMEWQGACIDKAYVKEALINEDSEQIKAECEFKKITGHEFKDSSKALATAFDAIGESYPRKNPTELMVKKAKERGEEAIGNPCFDDKALKKMITPAAKCIKRQRKASKRAGTYFRGFLYFSDDSDVLHCDLRQSGTDTGRMSCAEPNLQNLSKRELKEKIPYPVRRSIVPPEDYYLAMIDYDQMEYRLMLEYSKQFDLIERVKAGHDVHQATADLVGMSRDEAKNFNFMMIYGGGVAKAAEMAGVSYDKAFELRQKYFSALPQVVKFIKRVVFMAEKRGFIFNWFARKCHFTYHDAYKAPNYLIQGGCADVVKIAMNNVHDFLINHRTKMLLQVHDEMLFKVHKNERGIEEEIQKIMQVAYTHKYIPLTCSVEHSFKSWADKVEGIPGKLSD
jgi:DNA polymerase-1